MGYKEGKGLGKNAQGRVNIVEASLQRGRRGLGLAIQGLEPSMDVELRKENDHKKLTLDNEYNFCTKETLNYVLSCKRPMLQHDDLLYFADVCAGPCGFSEDILWRTKAEAKGFGLTLRGSNDFKLEDFFAGPPEMFEPKYGVEGMEGDGDIFNPANQQAFIKFIKENTEGHGVHMVMADGNDVDDYDCQLDLEEILNLDTDSERLQYAYDSLTNAKKPPDLVNEFVQELLSKAKTL